VVTVTMLASIQALRLFGVGVAFYAAWFQFEAGVMSGLALVAICWANGIGRHPR